MVTDFQKKVYKIVNKIKKGKVTTYKAIAKKLNTSPRAVGKALNSNPTPIKIPCHRVIHADGRIGGYKLGVKKKIELLKKEKFLNVFL
jgi:methylated-DNA-[protein]-cysteine S-methyltransferase